MRVCIVIQSDAFRDSAGMRIRYNRFQENLDGSGASIDALTVAELSAAKTLDHDVYVFCKTFDTGALLLARRLRAAGKTVGQDFFDDYFSQYSDRRLQRFRGWLRDMAPVTDFAVCSTPRMAEVLKSYLPAVKVTAIEDPVSGFDAAAVRQLAEAKIEAARASRTLEIVWFGIGDNPYFPVGLIDLAACESALAQIERAGWKVDLRIVTNRRPFDGAGGEILRRLSVGFELLEWSDDVELDALRRATVALLPVNAQSFSRAKSMNRAVTALNAGCQLLNLGYPLYERLGDFLYRSPDDLIADLEAGTLRASGERIDDLAAKLTELADPRQAAERFVGAARDAQSSGSKGDARRLVCLIHGRASTIGYHKAVGAIGGLSISTLFNKSSWNFPVRFDRLGRELVMRTTPQIAAKYELPVRSGDQPKRILDLEFVKIDTVALGLPQFFIDLPDPAHPILGLPIYEDVMRFAADACRMAFPGADVLVSDTSPIALSLGGLQSAKERTGRLGKPVKVAAPASARNKDATHWPLPKLRKAKGDLARALQLLSDSDLFEPGWYLQQYPDVAASGADPARHYLEFGWQEGRNPGPEFSTKAYLKRYLDVAEQGINPLLHFVEYGRAEGRTAPRVRMDAIAR